MRCRGCSRQIATPHRVSLKAFPSNRNGGISSRQEDSQQSKMPPERSASTKGKTIAFKPPRPVTKSAHAADTEKTVSSSSKTRPSKAAPYEEPALEEDHQGQPDAAPLESSQDAAPTLPPKLLTKLLHEHFTDDRTRINKDANKVVAKYMETFIKEALARAALEREESAIGGGATDGFLEVGLPGAQSPMVRVVADNGIGRGPREFGATIAAGLLNGCES